ncbi:MAG: PA14 domain-containing protein [Planctomycetota bacterium]|jgi:hypothetical protein
MFKRVISLLSFIVVFGLCGSIASGQENQIVNSEFDDGLDSWNLYGATGFNVEVVQGAGLSGNNAVVIDVTDASAGTMIGIYQTGLVIEPGVTYPIGFRARAEEDRQMVVLLQGSVNGSWPDYLTEIVDLTTTTQDYLIEYTHTGDVIGDEAGETLYLYLMLKGQYWPMDGDDISKKVWIDMVFFGAEILPQRLDLASDPDPVDGALHLETWVNLGWKASDFAVSHDVYMGENFDDVNDGLGDTFRGNYTIRNFVAGFSGYAYPEGLVPGTTYYWRIDEVNDADPNSPWKGNVWSFTVPHKIAYDPSPPNGDKFVAPDAVLDWKPGLEAKLHTVHFGENFDDVNNAALGGFPSLKPYEPGALEREKTYYWRVDEYDGSITRRGDVWSFTVAKEGGGLKAEYFDNRDLSGDPVLMRVDPQIDFNWGGGDVPGENSPDATVPVDEFSARWSGELEVDITDTYTFSIAANNGFRLYLDGQLIIDYWDNPGTEIGRSEPIELAGGTSRSIQLEYYEGVGTATVQLSWASSVRQEQIIPQAALSLPLKASGPIPANGVSDAQMTAILTWSAGDSATSHEIYFGTDANAVLNATTASPEYKGTKPIGSENYDPGKLAWDTTYYWRVDEVDSTSPDGRWTGSLWSFKTRNFIVIDDFEDYNAGDNQIWFAWHDGLGAGTPGSPNYVPPNGTGSAVGNDTPPYTEETIVHGGRQSMPFTYNNQGLAMYSEAELTLTDPRDWTENGVEELSIWFRGNPGSTGSFVEGADTITMTGSGADIWGESDEFHYAFKSLTGAGSIVAKVESIENTWSWAKAGVMIRETLDADSAHAMMVVTPTQGISFQRRNVAGGSTAEDTTGGINAPYWVKIERDVAGNFIAYSSTNGSDWQMQGLPDNITMGSNVHIGLIVCSTNAPLTCLAEFSNVTISGGVSGQWSNQDIGIASNSAEPLYVAVSNAAGVPAVVVHNDPDAATIDTWSEWVIPLQAFADQGIALANVDRIAIGLGTKGNTTIPGGSGKMYFDDIRLYGPRDIVVEE